MQPFTESNSSQRRAPDALRPAGQLASAQKLSGRAGFSLVEVMISVLVVTVATYIFTSTVMASVANSRYKRERAAAAEEMYNVIERIRACPPQDVFALFNDEPSDDPYGAGTAPGHLFDIQGLSPQLSARGVPISIGEILLPGRGRVLDESLRQAEFGLPRDLDGSMFVEEGDCSSRYVLLPVIVRARWRGRLGDREMEVATVVVDRKRGLSE